MKNKVNFHEVLHEAYSRVPYYIKEDAGFSVRFENLTTGEMNFLEDLIYYAGQPERESMQELLNDLRNIKTDLEGVLNDYNN